ncbi:MAG: response regulator [Schleiferiaceae bacterium]|nr:response regulator [Schleiferiaceae bacterium]
MTYDYVIIENNPGQIDFLQVAMADFKSFTFAGSCGSLVDAIGLISKKHPHLVFLDVELNDGSGIELLKQLRTHIGRFPLVIMMTDYIKYGKYAVNYDVLYFLDKPTKLSELSLALLKFEKRFNDTLKHFTIKDHLGYSFYDFKEIVYIESKSSSSIIYLANQDTPVLLSKSIGELERVLPSLFLRIHKQYIVNTDFIKRFNTHSKKVELNISTKVVTLNIGTSHLAFVKQQLLTAKV